MKPTENNFYIAPVTQQDVIDATERARALRAKALRELWVGMVARIRTIFGQKRLSLRHS